MSFMVQPTCCSRKFHSKSEIIFVWEVHLSTVIVSKSCLTSLLYLGSVMLNSYGLHVGHTFHTKLMLHALHHDLQACSESSKSGLYKASNFGWLRNTFTFIQNWIIQNIQFQKKYNHPKVDYTKLLPLDDLQAHSESSKSGLYKTFTFGWFASMLRIIQKWIIQNFHLWMICKHAQNHPKVDYTKFPPLDDLQACYMLSNWQICLLWGCQKENEWYSTMSQGNWACIPCF